MHALLISDKLAATKTGLQDEDFEVTKNLRRVKLRYDYLYQIVHDLSQTYGYYMYSYRYMYIFLLFLFSFSLLVST